MKQSAVKTLGVAALGAAFAAVGAGAAHAAPAAPQGLDSVTKTLPGATGALTQGQSAVGSGLTAAQPAVQKVLAKGPAAPVAGLLGGLPLKGLPTHGLPVNGIPLG
ncbi:hypothetical protein [Streptomyces sp. LaPpAH-108]|uniref:hypothetical protein n=1 Tax=Streptomyces sp. LaPpAH-108 TaxID=1155714 RepID=UPI000364A19C|nr:hypothetical protein [Streptomyces sp. LaPpAH-108]